MISTLQFCQSVSYGSGCDLTWLNDPRELERNMYSPVAGQKFILLFLELVLAFSSRKKKYSFCIFPQPLD